MQFYNDNVGFELVIFVFQLQLISDAGYQGEITSVSTACHQIEVFSRVLKTSVGGFLEDGEVMMDTNLPEFAVSSLWDLNITSKKISTVYNNN